MLQAVTRIIIKGRSTYTKTFLKQDYTLLYMQFCLVTGCAMIISVPVFHMVGSTCLT